MSLAQTRNANQLVVTWNNMFPLDKWYRDKWGVALFSQDHLEIDPINQVLEWIEEKEFEKYAQEKTMAQEKAKLLADGEWLTPRSSSGKAGFTDEEFNAFDIDNVILE